MSPYMESITWRTSLCYDFTLYSFILPSPPTWWTLNISLSSIRSVTVIIVKRELEKWWVTEYSPLPALCLWLHVIFVTLTHSAMFSPLSEVVAPVVASKHWKVVKISSILEQTFIIHVKFRSPLQKVHYLYMWVSRIYGSYSGERISIIFNSTLNKCISRITILWLHMLHN